MRSLLVGFVGSIVAVLVLASCRAISTNILDLRARVLVISGGKGLILDAVLPVHWTCGP